MFTFAKFLNLINDCDFIEPKVPDNTDFWQGVMDDDYLTDLRNHKFDDIRIKKDGSLIYFTVHAPVGISPNAPNKRRYYRLTLDNAKWELVQASKAWDEIDLAQFIEKHTGNAFIDSILGQHIPGTSFDDIKFIRKK